MPIVHPCGCPGCNVLTMGEFCLDHEPRPAGSGRTRILSRVGTVLAVVAAGAAAAFVRAHLPR